MAHLKRLRPPKTWQIQQRKERTFIARPLPGPHKLREATTLNYVLIDLLQYAKTAREAQFILNSGKVVVNSKVRKTLRFPVGVVDIVSILEENKVYRLVYDKFNKFSLAPVNHKEAAFLLCKIVNKTVLNSKKIQLNFHNGRNLLVDSNAYKVSDSVLLNANKIEKHLKFEPGARVYLTAGKSKGKIGTLEKTEKSSELSPELVTVNSGTENIVTIKDYVFVINKEFTL